MNIIRVLPAISLYLVTITATDAALAPLAPDNFAPGATTLDFSSIPSSTEVNGLIVNNVVFKVTDSGLPKNGMVIIDGGPNVANNVTAPNIVSILNPDGLALDISLPGLMTQFGYGFALLASDLDPAATTIQLFSGITPIGSIDFAGTPDPLFTGGFAGVTSTASFDRAVLTFSTLGPAFAVDNVTFANVVPEHVPEQEWTLILFAMAVVGLFLLFTPACQSSRLKSSLIRIGLNR